ncbi:hypothetical protein QA596_06500 [Balneolales bacterium ANBcel1]|nr:hypothetical protein [Balneolales bacterium ANBcel1]
MTWAQPDGSGRIEDPFSAELLAGIDAVVLLKKRGNAPLFSAHIYGGIYQAVTDYGITE